MSKFETLKPIKNDQFGLEIEKLRTEKPRSVSLCPNQLGFGLALVSWQHTELIHSRGGHESSLSNHKISESAQVGGRGQPLRVCASAHLLEMRQ